MESAAESAARLADFSGIGALSSEQSEGGGTMFVGLWRADDPEHAYDALHKLYMAREPVRFNGPIQHRAGEVREDVLDVIIVEWSNEDHPAALKLQGPAEEY